MIVAAQKAGSRVLLVGMRLPPNYGADYVRASLRSSAKSRKTRKTALVPFLFEGFGEDNAMFQPDRIHPIAAAQTKLLDNVWRALKPMLGAPAKDEMSAADPGVRRVGVAALADYPDRIDVRSPAEFALDHVPGAANHPVLDDAERARIGTLYARIAVRGAQARCGDRRAQHRDHARDGVRGRARASGSRSCIAGAAASAAARSRRC